MTEIEYRVADLINFSSNQKPIDFDKAFRSIMTAKVTDAIEVKKMDVAQTMFARDEAPAEEDVESDDVEHQEEPEEEVHAEVA